MIECAPVYVAGIREERQHDFVELQGFCHADRRTALEATMATQEETEALVKYLDDVLRGLAHGSHEPPGSCCACLQDVEARGHLPSCSIRLALIEIEEWRE